MTPFIPQPSEGRSRREALERLVKAAVIGSGLGPLIVPPVHAGAQVEERLSHAVRTALSAAVANAAPPEPVLVTPADHQAYADWLAQQPEASMAARRAEAEMIFRRVGITFAVYGAKDEDGAGTERLIPFDLIPRVIPSAEWKRLEQGLVQRVAALNRFIHDVYHGQDIIKAGIVPADQIFQNAQFP
jgi:uncharacterized circularly permuted ATP-grasp superfamily protein